MNRRHRGQRPRQRRFFLWFLVGGSLAAAALWGVWALRTSGGGGGSAQPISRLQTQDFHSLAFSPSEPDTVFFGHHGGLLVSRNGGRDWEPTSLRNADAMALAAPPSDPRIRYAAGHNIFFRSTDGGETWQPVSTNLPGLDIHGFAADPDRPELVHAHVVGFGLFRSEDAGDTWELRYSTMAALNLAVGEAGDRLYASAARSGLLGSSDGGLTWSQVPGPPGGGAIALAFDRPTGRLYVTTLDEGAGLYFSEDGGETWSPLGLRGTLLAIAVSPHDPQRLIAVDDRGWVYASRDGGVTWSAE